MTSSSHHSLSWQVTSLSVLAGLGAGYLVGVLTAKWLQRGRRLSPTPALTPSRQSYADLAASLTALTAEVGNLRSVLTELIQHLGRQAEGSVGFVTGSPQSEGTEFFDIEDEVEVEGEGEEASGNSTEYLDELGKTTLEDEGSCHTLIAELDHRLKESPDTPPLLWRLSRAQVHLSIHCEGKGLQEEEKQLLVKATGHAQRALELDTGLWQCHQWYAIALGSQIKYEGIQRKITAGHEYKEHIDTAISLNPEEHMLYYLRGRWAYEVAALTWLEKKAASALFATPPSATYEDALGDFLKVEQLHGGMWKANLLMVAKCHIKLGDTPTAVDWLERAAQLEVVTAEDKTSQKEVEQLLDTHSQVDSYS